MINNERVLIVFARIISNCRLKLRKLRRGKVLLLLKGENSTILWLSRNCRAGERQRERKGSRKIPAFLLLRLIVNAPLVFPPSVCYHNIFKAERKLLRSSLSSGRWLKPMHQIPNSKTDTLKTTSGTKKKKWSRREWRFRIYSRDKSEMSAGMDLCVTFCSSFSFRARASNIFALPSSIFLFGSLSYGLWTFIFATIACKSLFHLLVHVPYNTKLPSNQTFHPHLFWARHLHLIWYDPLIRTILSPKGCVKLGKCAWSKIHIARAKVNEKTISGK